MYKYLWIIMLVIAALVFVGYTIYCIYESYKYWKHYKQRSLQEGIQVSLSLSDVAYDFWRHHISLCFWWCLLILSALTVLFLDSLFTYVHVK